MRENLDRSLELMFGHEGGYVNVATDKGGPTKYGITHRTLAAHRGVSRVTAEQVKAMNIAEARDIYIESYWSQSGADQLPAGLDYAVFDFGVNSGPPTAVKRLQKIVGTAQDGWVGPETVRAVAAYPGGLQQLIRDYCDERMRYLRSLKSSKTGFPVNGRGWTIRVTGVDPDGKWKSAPGVLGNALAMARHQPTKATTTAPSIVTEEGSAKATPPEPNAWTKPDVLLPVAGAAATGAGTVLTSGMDPIKLALAIGIIVIIVLGAYFAFRRIQKSAP